MKILNHNLNIRALWQLRSTVIALLCDPAKLRNLFAAVCSLRRNDTVVRADPVVLMLEPSSQCNLECPMCPRQLKQTKRWEGDMPFENYTGIIDELAAGLMFLILWNYGEPLLNKNIGRMIGYAKERKIAVAMSTNGLLLSEEKSMELIDSRLDFLIVSFDGGTRETYETNRKNGDFEKTLENIRGLMKLKRMRRSRTPFVNLECVVMKNNEHETAVFERLARMSGVDGYSLKKVAYVKGRESDFLPVNQRLTCDVYQKGNRRYCSRLSLSSVVNANGDVVPCCSDIAFQYVLGNVFRDNGFRRIWNNELYQAFRKRAFRDLAHIDICQNCGGHSFTSKVYIS